MQTMTTATETIIDTLRGLDYDPTSITSPAGDVTFIDADAATTYRLGPEFDGFEMECGRGDETPICIPKCNEANECPKTGGVELHCSDFYCIGDS